MNREIKFRAWDKKTNSWYDDSNQHLVIDLDGTLTNCWNGELMEDYTERIILLPFTGLEDKNGIEIYEGDIVKRTHLFNGGYGETHTGEVVYDKEYARYVISRPKKHIEPRTEDLRNALSDKSTYEVIGNIRENPEWLEVES